MSHQRIRPEKVTRPFQLVAALLVFVILLDGLFLGAAELIAEPSWAADLLVAASIAVVPILLLFAFLLITRFRPAMQEDQYYAAYLARTMTGSTRDVIAAAEAEGERVDVLGNPDQLKLLFKVQGLGWRKSTKAMDVPGGCLVQVTNERLSPDGDWTVAEALQYVPDARVLADSDGQLHRLGPLS